MNNNFFEKFIKYFVGNLASKVLYFLFGIFAARIYGIVIYGEYNYALSIVSYFIMFANLGIQGYAQFAVSKEPKKAAVYYNEVITIEILLGIVASCLLFIFTMIIPTNREMLLIVGSTILISALNIDWLFFAKQESHMVSTQLLITYGIQILLLYITFIIGNTKSYYLPILVSIGQLIGNLFLHIIAKLRFGFRYSFSIKDFSYNVKKGIPYLFSGIFAGINCNIDSIIIANIMDSEAVGAYSAAYKIINIFIVLLATIYAPMFPLLVQTIKNDSKKYETVINKMRKISAIFIFPCVFGGVILCNQIIEFMYGKQYSSASGSFKILMLFLGVFYMREIYGYTLTALGEQKKYMIGTCISSVINVVLNIIIIPILGIEGAALTTLISEIVNFVYMKYYASKAIKSKIDYNVLLKIVLSGVVMSICAVVFLKFQINVVVNIICCAMIYALVLITFKVITINDIKEIRNKI